MGFNPIGNMVFYLLPLNDSDQTVPARYTKMTLLSNFCEVNFFVQWCFGGVLALLATEFRATTPHRWRQKKYVFCKSCSQYMVFYIEFLFQVILVEKKQK